MSKTGTGRAECQICEGHFSNTKGTLAKHGFKRPGCGFLIGACYGAHRLPYKATDALVEYRVIIGNMLTDARADLARFDGEPVFETKEEMMVHKDGEIVREPRHGMMCAVMYEAKVTWAPFVSCPYTYKRKLEEERKPRARHVRELENELTRVNLRILKATAVAS